MNHFARRTAGVLILTLFLFSGFARADKAGTFQARILPLPANVLEKMKIHSWHPGCPVDLTDLRYLRLSHWGFDGKVHQGELVVHHRVAQDVADIFAELFEKRFPIEKMRLIDEYRGSDDASMADDNTSAFNCRFVSGTNHWSLHAYGLALDVNPLINPYVTGKRVSPQAGEKYLDRTMKADGLVTRGGVCYQAFVQRGWRWGGDWKNSKDYQHFDTRLK